MQSSQSTPFSNKRDWIFGLLLVTAVILAYQQVWRGEFLWDDDSWTTGITGLLRNFSGLQKIWFQPMALQQYYPLTGTSFWIDYQLWDFWTPPYHVENIFLHAFAALLFWRLLLQLQVAGAKLASALFAFHPVMVESVAWITERKNTLSLVFFLGSLLAYGRFTNFWKAESSPANFDSSTAHRRRIYALAFLLFLCALLAKTTAFSLPAVILLICWWKRGRIRWHTDVLPTMPFFVLSTGFGLLTSWLEKHHVGATGSDWAISFPERCLIVGRTPWFYIGKLVWPTNLCFVYPRWQLDVGSWWQWIFPVAAIGVLLGLWFARTRIGRGPVAAALYFVGTLFPVLGFMNAYFMRYSFVCDHWVYLSSLGPIALVASAIAGTTKSLQRPIVFKGFVAVLLLTFGVLTWRQCGMYADIETLWRTTIARNPNAFLAHNNLGVILIHKGNVDDAITYFQRALHTKPDFVNAHHNLGNALIQKGNVEVAIVHYQKALEGEPDNAYVLNDLAWIRAAAAQAEFRNGPEAVRLAERACRVTDYRFPLMIGTLAAAYAEVGRYDEAVSASEKARGLALILGQKEITEKNEKLIQLFKTQQPYRESVQ